MRIDAHQHFWDLDRFPYPWMPPAPSPLRRTFLPEDLQPILERNRFDGSVVVQATTVPGEATWLLELADKHPMILGVVAWVDLTDPSLGKTLDKLQTKQKFKGVRHPVHDEADDRWLLKPEVIRGLKELERRKIPYDLLLAATTSACSNRARRQNTFAQHGNRSSREATHSETADGGMGGEHRANRKGAPNLCETFRDDYGSAIEDMDFGSSETVCPTRLEYFRSRSLHVR